MLQFLKWRRELMSKISKLSYKSCENLYSKKLQICKKPYKTVKNKNNLEQSVIVFGIRFPSALGRGGEEERKARLI